MNRENPDVMQADRAAHQAACRILREEMRMLAFGVLYVTLPPGILLLCLIPCWGLIGLGYLLLAALVWPWGWGLFQGRAQLRRHQRALRGERDV